MIRCRTIDWQTGMGRVGRLMAGLALAATLGACDTVKGLANLAGGGDQPQEVTDDSVRRPPLTLPPDYNLRPPSATTGNATDFTAAQQGRQAVFGLDSTKPAAGPQVAGRSPGEAALLQRAGAIGVSSAIRTKVDQTTKTLSQQDQAFTNNLLKGQPADQAQKKADTGLLEGIFNPEQKPTIERKSGGLF